MENNCKKPPRKLNVREQRLEDAHKMFELLSRGGREKLVRRICGELPEIALQGRTVEEAAEVFYEKSLGSEVGKFDDTEIDQFNEFVKLTELTVVAQVRNKNHPEFAAGDILFEWLTAMNEGTEVYIPNVDADVPKREDWDAMLAKGKTAADIANTDYPPLRWVADGIIPQGLIILAAQAKIGKSWFALQLTLSVAGGMQFLGEVETTRGKVLYIALEDNERRIKSRMQKMNMPAPADCTFYHQWTDNFQLLEYAIEKTSPALIVIDTWGRFVSTVCKDPNDYNETTALAANLHGLAHKYETTIIAVTHTRKGQGCTDWLDDVIGSKALTAVADTIIGLKRERGEDAGEMRITGRDVSEETYQIEHGDDWVWVLSEDQSETSTAHRVIYDALRDKGEAVVESKVRFLNRQTQKIEKQEVEFILRDLVAVKLFEREFIQNPRGGRGAYWYSISDMDSVSATTTLKNIGKKGGCGSTDTVPLAEFRDFSDADGNDADEDSGENCAGEKYGGSIMCNEQPEDRTLTDGF